MRSDVDKRVPEYITWGLALTIWFLLNAFVVRQTFNPHYPDYERHEWYDEYTRQYNDDWSALGDDDGEGNYWINLPNRWRDGRTRKVYTFKHPDVISGIRWEKVSRGLFTFLCGLPIVCFYYVQWRRHEEDPERLRKRLINGLLFCGLAALILGLIGSWAQSLVDTIGSLLGCGAIVLPFVVWSKRHLLFGRKKVDETVD